MAQRRFKTDDSRTSLTETTEQAVIPEEKPRNAPDYGVHIDRATSYVLQCQFVLYRYEYGNIADAN